ncbi:MAG: hypothetical protein KA715_10195 [Xanthomonadaceae bacterium]|nr:hypothetical protein [Xanthomonadaceae bacterium]
MGVMGGAPFRRRILMGVGGLIVLSVLGSTLSLYRITQVNGALDRISKHIQPMNRWLVQLRADSDTLKREWGRDSASPLWVVEVMGTEIERLKPYIESGKAFDSEAHAKAWKDWLVGFSAQWEKMRAELKAGTQNRATFEEYVSELEWAVGESDRLGRLTLVDAERRVGDLKTGLQILLAVIVGLSLLLLWFGEHALRPLQDLIGWVRQISEKGLAKEFKSKIPALSLTRNDEVSTLAWEFHRMATHLLEWEKQVESQSARLESQNKLLRELATLNRNILSSMQSVLIVTNLKGQITQSNPQALKWLGALANDVLGHDLTSVSMIQKFVGTHLDEIPTRIEPKEFEGKVLGGSFHPLRHETGEPCGWVLLIEDFTDQIEIQRRLQSAEQLAAVARLSAQVAHEVRNPLHSIGLEAELVLDGLEKSNSPLVRSSVQSILESVDRLENITQSYLRLSKLSSGKIKSFSMSEVAEVVIAQYATVCEKQKIDIDWNLSQVSHHTISGDFDSWVQALSNLMQNSIQAEASKIEILGTKLESFLEILWMDNGPGVPESVKEKLFQPFVTSKAEGTGLGLPLVQKVIHEAGGVIEYEDRASGGACFRMSIPLGRVSS